MHISVLDYLFIFKKILEPPWFGNVMFNKQVKVGEEAVLECLSNGSPKPKIKWTKDGIPLIKSNRHFFTTDDQLLVIMETKIDDSGTYQCEIANSLGKNTQEIEVHILPRNIYFIFEIIYDYYNFKIILIENINISIEFLCKKFSINFKLHI